MNPVVETYIDIMAWVQSHLPAVFSCFGASVALAAVVGVCAWRESRAYHNRGGTNGVM